LTWVKDGLLLPVYTVPRNIHANETADKNIKKETAMKTMDLDKARAFDPKKMNKFLVHDSAYFRIINFNLAAGITFPVHSHDLDGQLSILVIEGQGEFLGRDKAIPAKTGDILISDIREPHGVRAVTDMRIIVTIAPPL